MITVTEKAASEVRRIVEEQKFDEEVYLRLRVTGGGCSGFSHKLDLDAVVNELDETFESGGVKLVVDRRSLLYLEGAIVDFSEDLNKRGFVVKNPNARSTCGCGSSFSVG